MKEHKFGNITYYFSRENRKWTFRAVNGQLHATFYFVCGGSAVAHKVARIIAGAFKRTKQLAIDNLARANMTQVGAI